MFGEINSQGSWRFRKARVWTKLSLPAARPVTPPFLRWVSGWRTGCNALRAFYQTCLPINYFRVCLPKSKTFHYSAICPPFPFNAVLPPLHVQKRFVKVNLEAAIKDSCNTDWERGTECAELFLLGSRSHCSVLLVVGLKKYSHVVLIVPELSVLYSHCLEKRREFNVWMTQRFIWTRTYALSPRSKTNKQASLKLWHVAWDTTFSSTASFPLQCSVSCGVGIQRRKLACQSLTAKGQYVTVNGSMCSGLSPSLLVRSCQMNACNSKCGTGCSFLLIWNDLFIKKNLYTG